MHQLVHADESVEDEQGKSRNPEEEVVDLKRQVSTVSKFFLLRIKLILILESTNCSLLFYLDGFDETTNGRERPYHSAYASTDDEV